MEVNQEKKKILIIGEVESQNLGDQAIFACLKAELELLHFNVEGICLSCKSAGKNPRTVDSKRQARSLIKQFNHLLYNRFPYYTKLINLITFLRKRKGRYEFLMEAISSVDIVVIGGGQLLQNNNWSFPFDLNLVLNIINKQKKGFYIVGCGFGSKGWDYVSKRLLAPVFSSEYLQDVFLRDIASIENLASLFKCNAKFIPDPAISISEHLRPVNISRTGIERAGIGVISPNTLIRNNHLPQYNKASHIDFWFNVFEDLVSRNIEIVLFTTGDMGDFEFANEILEINSKTKKFPITILDNPRSLKDLVVQIISFDFIISMRLHSHIIAFSYMIPSYGIIWENKVLEFSKYTNSTFAFTDSLDFEFLQKSIFNHNNVQRTDVNELISEIKFTLDSIR